MAQLALQEEVQKPSSTTAPADSPQSAPGEECMVYNLPFAASFEIDAQRKPSCEYPPIRSSNPARRADEHDTLDVAFLISVRIFDRTLFTALREKIEKCERSPREHQRYCSQAS